MKKRKKKMEWPEHSTWWERNQKRVMRILLVVFISTAIISRFIKDIVYKYPLLAVAWVILFTTSGLLFSLLMSGPRD